eukprot:Filipodium_phascolosomae@DN2387_c0_g1_i2.p1
MYFVATDLRAYSSCYYYYYYSTIWITRTRATAPTGTAIHEVTPELMKIYYGHLFPFELFTRWLSYGNTADEPPSVANDPTFFHRREISYECDKLDAESGKMASFVIRYKSYPRSANFRLECEKLQPRKLDIGPVYDKPPSIRNSVSTPLVPVERELIFDIDMDDYDPIRRCCTGAKVCTKCWRFLTVACRVLTRALSEDFGFKHLLWIYSGRRGIHCWVCDRVARQLSNEARGAVADYMNLVAGDAMKTKACNLAFQHRHPMVRASVRLCKEHFLDIITEQESFAGEKMPVTENELDPRTVIKLHFTPHAAEVASVIQKENTKKYPQCLWKQSATFWKAFTESLLNEKKRMHTDARGLDEVVLLYTYPRLDINVSKSMNHLLKAPFCVHPKSGRVCIPVMFTGYDDPGLLNFNPEKVPTLASLVEELERGGVGPNAAKDISATGGGAGGVACMDTSLAPYLLYFQKFVEELESDERLQKSGGGHNSSGSN